MLNALSLGGAVSIGLTSRMGDRYGHRKVLIALTLLAMAGCALAAAGTGFWPLVIGRFLAGLALGIPLGWGLLRPRGTARVVRNVSLVFALVTSVGAPLVLVASSLMLNAGIPWQALWGIANPASMALMSRRVGPDEQGQLQGANASIAGIAGDVMRAAIAERGQK